GWRGALRWARLSLACFDWYRGLHVCDFEWDHNERRARAVRDVAGWIFFPVDRESTPAFSHAVGRTSGAVWTVNYFAAHRRKLSPILLTGHLRRMALLHDRRQHSICLPPPRAKCATTL